MKSLFKVYPQYKWLLLIYDLVSLNIILFSAYFIRFKNINLSILFNILASFILVYIFHSMGLYKYHLIEKRSKHLVLYIKSILYIFLTGFFAQYLINPEILIKSRLFYIIFLSLMILAGIIRVELLKFLFSNKFFISLVKNRIIIFGAGDFGRLMAEKILQKNTPMYEIVGFIDENIPVGTEIYLGLRVIGTFNDIPQIVEKLKIDEVIVAINNIDYNQLIEKIEYLNGTPIKVSLATNKYDIIARNFKIDYIQTIPIYHLNNLRTNIGFLIFKRIFDVVFSILLLLLLMPIFVIIGILIKFSSPGPIIFSQTRIGFRGKPFKFYKFRSMYVGSDNDPIRIEMMKNFIKGNYKPEKDTKVVNESNIIPIGKFIRKYSIDELPQLYNVLKGDMSLVGPRPMLLYEWEMLNSWQKRRAEVKPGCTGLWQVSERGKSDFETMLIMDLYYIDNISPWLDLEILLKTIPTVIMGKGGK